MAVRSSDSSTGSKECASSRVKVRSDMYPFYCTLCLPQELPSPENCGWETVFPAAGSKNLPRGELLRENYGVDDVDDSVGANDIRLGDVGVVDHDFAALGHDLHVFAIYGLGLMQFHHVLGHDLSRHHVISQDRHQLVVVLRFQQAIDRAGWQLGECFVGWSEHGER